MTSLISWRVAVGRAQEARRAELRSGARERPLRPTPAHARRLTRKAR